MPILHCANVTKTFHHTPVVRGVSFSAHAGEIVTLLGPSGCGKTTTLRLIAGFEWPDAGTITVNGRVVAGEGLRIPPEERRIGMVFQEYALFPHLDVAGNIAFGLADRKADKARRVDEMLHLVGLAGLNQRMPYALSGGQQQRVALARALAPRPDILLLDEPFSNLDAALRAQVRGEVRAILKAAATTAVFVTHDQEEALSLADQVAVMFDGHIAQYATPQTIYHQPATRAVAAFVGEANFLPAHAHGTAADCVLGQVPLRDHRQGRVDLLLRPEMLHLTPAPDGSATLLWTEFYGHDQRIGLRLADGTRLIARADSTPTLTSGQRVHVAVRGAAQCFEPLAE